MESDLAAGEIAAVPTTGIAFQASYGFIYLKDRSLTLAALTWMEEVRAVEANIVKREAVFASRYGDLSGRRPALA